MIRSTAFVILFSLIGCGPAQKSEQEATVHIIDAFGATKIDQYKWKVIATEGKEIEFQKILDEKGGYIGSGLPEAPKKGWFVVIPSSDQLWYFNGDGDGALIQKTPEKTIVWGLWKTPMPPPTEFLSRLPAKVRESITKSKVEQGAAANP